MVVPDDAVFEKLLVREGSELAESGETEDSLPTPRFDERLVRAGNQSLPWLSHCSRVSNCMEDSMEFRSAIPF